MLPAREQHDIFLHAVHEFINVTVNVTVLLYFFIKLNRYVT